MLAQKTPVGYVSIWTTLLRKAVLPLNPDYTPRDIVATPLLEPAKTRLNKLCARTLLLFMSPGWGCKSLRGRGPYTEHTHTYICAAPVRFRPIQGLAEWAYILGRREDEWRFPSLSFSSFYSFGQSERT